MERLQVGMEKMGVGSKRSTTVLVLLLVGLPVLLLVTVIYQKASPNYLTCIKGEASELANGVKDKDLLEHSNVTSVRGSDQALSDVGSRNVSLAGSKNASSQSGTREPNGVLDDVGSGNASSFSLGLKNTSSSSGTRMPNAEIDDDGLVAPGLEQGSCISRHQSHLYRRNKNSPYRPSEFLISKLRAYEHHHTQCGPQSKSYRAAMRGLVKPDHRNGTTADCKYTVWLPANGLGNRMLSIVAGFLWSILTDRVLLVNFEKDMVGLFCEPFPNSTWMLPRDFPNKGKRKHLPTYGSLLNSSDRFQAPGFVFLGLSHGNEDHVRFFHCNRSQSLLSNVPVVFLESDQYFVPSLFMEESFRKNLNRMFPEKVAVFHLLGKYLFNPSNEAWGLITRFHQAYLSEADNRIGLQIRVFNSETANLTKVMEGISSCTSTNKLLPEVGDPELASSPHRNTSSTAILVASLFLEFAENLRTVYWTRPTITGETVSVHQPSHDGEQKFNDRTQNLQAWAEIYLLSLCDELVTSARSTFGYVAHSLGGIRPWILPRDHLDSYTGRNCQRALSMEPCNHYPPSLDCETKAKLDIPSRFPNMMACEDFNIGVKMVD